MRKAKYILALGIVLLTVKSNFAVAAFMPANKYFSTLAVSDTSLLEDKKFNLYVNQGQLNIKCNKPQELQNGEVVVYNLLGQEVTRKKLETLVLNQISIPVQNTCYLVRINYSGKVYTQKVIVRASF